MTAVILGVVAGGLAWIRWLDPHTPIPVTRRCRMAVLAGGVEGSLPVWYLTGTGDYLAKLLLAVIWGCFLLACITDVAICQVYNFVWWISGAAALVLLWLRCRLPHTFSLPGASNGTDGIEAMGAILVVPGSMVALAAFCVLQLLLFARLYGLADCYAFCVCALVECAYGAGMREYLMHMLLAVVLLLPIQAVKRNLNRYGNLKKPVPFLPYITISFYLVFFLKYFGRTVV